MRHGCRSARITDTDLAKRQDAKALLSEACGHPVASVQGPVEFRSGHGRYAASYAFPAHAPLQKRVIGIERRFKPSVDQENFCTRRASRDVRARLAVEYHCAIKAETSEG